MLIKANGQKSSFLPIFDQKIKKTALAGIFAPKIDKDRFLLCKNPCPVEFPRCFLGLRGTHKIISGVYPRK